MAYNRRKVIGNKFEIRALVSRRSHDALKAVHSQMLSESGGPSWNRFIESVLSSGLSGNDLFKGYYKRYIDRINSTGSNV